MMIARWSIDARFGHKSMVVSMMQRWMKEIGSEIGWNANQTRLLTGSIGALESTIQAEVLVRDLAELDAAWNKLAKIEAHQRWSKEMEPYVVSGSPRWEIFRLIE